MTVEDLKAEVYSAMINKPKNWREGQFVFNYIEEVYGSEVARHVQFVDNVDCFYMDEEMDNFIEHCVKRINELEEG